MSRRTTSFAALVLGVAALTVTGSASAGEWTLDAGAGKNIAVRKVNNPVFTVVGGQTINCNGLNGNGVYAADTTGNITLTFNGCKENAFGTNCTTPGHAAGSITIANKTFHNVIIGDAGDEFTPIGILITSGTGDLATFSCAGGLINITITGNVIGELEAPKCGVEGKKYFLNFESAAHGVQKYQQITTAGAAFDIVADVGAEQPRTSSIDLTAEVEFAANVKPTCF